MKVLTFDVEQGYMCEAGGSSFQLDSFETDKLAVTADNKITPKGFVTGAGKGKVVTFTNFSFDDINVLALLGEDIVTTKFVLLNFKKLNVEHIKYDDADFTNLSVEKVEQAGGEKSNQKVADLKVK